MTTTAITESLVSADLVTALPISPSTTTSRVVVNNPLLRVVAFAMDAGQELTDHSSPRAVVVQMVEGTLRFTVAGDEQQLTSGDVVYLAPDARHALVAETPCRFVLVLVVTGG
jgi:quercetin dioxygenase-like cupin family protein